MFVEVAVFVVGCYGGFDDVGVEFDHVWFVAADECNVAALLAALRVEKIVWRKQRLCAGGRAENDISAADVFFEEAGIFRVAGGEDACLGLVAVFVAERVLIVRVIREGVVEFHQHFACSVEGAIDNIYVVNF